MHLSDVLPHLISPFEGIGVCYLHKDALACKIKALAHKHLDPQIHVSAKNNMLVEHLI